MRKHALWLWILAATALLVACQKSEPSPFPPFDDASNIVVNGEKVTARQYFERYCDGKPGGADNMHCKAAVEQSTKDFLTPSGPSKQTKVGFGAGSR